MTYENLTHEQKELVLYIKNNEKAYRVVQSAESKNMYPIVKQCGINYYNTECAGSGIVFFDEDYKKVASYFNNQ